MASSWASNITDAIVIFTKYSNSLSGITGVQSVALKIFHDVYL